MVEQTKLLQDEAISESSGRVDLWVGQAEQQIDVADLLLQTAAALEHFDSEALAKLLARAERLNQAPPNAEALLAAREQHNMLRELLAATDRNLKMLRRMRGESGPDQARGEEIAWVR